MMVTTAQPPLIVIVGGGISGLCAAYYLLQSAQLVEDQPVRVLVIERDERLGGKIRTDTLDTSGELSPFIIEGGPDAFLSGKPWAADLARDLGLGDQLMPINSVQPATSILVHGKPVPLPAGLRLITPTRLLPFLSSPVISVGGKAEMLLDLVRPARRIYTDESLADFVRARLGEEVLERLAEPLMSGIYSGDPEQLSMLATFPQLRSVEAQYGSIIRGTSKSLPRSTNNGGGGTLSPFLTLRGGMSMLVDALRAKLDGHIRSGRRVVQITPGSRPPSSYRLELDDGTVLDAQTVVITTPAFAAASLVESWHPKLAAKLRRIPYLSTGTISLAYHRADIQRPFAGFGLVMPHSEGRLLNAITVSSEKFAHRAPPGQVLLRVFFGGFRNQNLVDETDTRLLELAARELCELMGIAEPPRFARIYRWRDASPQYHVGHLDLVKEIMDLPPPHLWLCGSAYQGVGIPDCVRQAKNVAEQVFQEIQRDLPVLPTFSEEA